MTIPYRAVRDWWVLTLGSGLLASQVLWQFLGNEPNLIIASAGVSLLAGYPLLKVGDRREGEP